MTMTIQLAAHKLRMSEQRLQELIDGDIAPHRHTDNGPPEISLTELSAWVKQNLTDRHGGWDLPRRINVLMPRGPIDGVPASLATLPNLQRMEVSSASGIYFLVKDGIVVYVGQSSSVMSRIGQHCNGEKEFDVAFWLPYPIERLNEMERHFVEALEPKYNGGAAGVRHCNYIRRGRPRNARMLRL